ncbi:uncharacterized protein B0I36DRAFT_363409 [Microdochium trichocladiopsis]|uniref:Uncharacterized protein n=1 Tax=Microdochium trichocladiopsis TaxID=1682393 RepID=A0A9P8Y1M8_9PEZI|nr:uncharacterized protein B0I36DRAFT_363409 [Microdochium trichocladiopsis]KAH7028784.1 hypothetical protein B0I36DRAFT_363409 [Microdochium trichocladiopsis]
MSPLTQLASRVPSTLSRMVAREDKNCINEAGGDSCALPVAGTHTTEIVIGSIVGVLAIIVVVVLVHFHFRRQRMDKKEWTGKNSQELDDYGLGAAGAPAKPKSTYQASAAHSKSTTDQAPSSSEPSAARRTSQDSLRSLEMSLRQQAKPADMV